MSEQVPYPMNVDAEGWEPFGSDEHDASSENERKAFTRFFAERVRRLERKGRSPADAFVGGMHALVQILFAMADHKLDEQHRQNLHKAFDYAWLQVEGMSRHITGEPRQ